MTDGTFHEKFDGTVSEFDVIRDIRSALSAIPAARRQAILRFVAETEIANQFAAPYADQFAAEQQRAGVSLMGGLGAQRANTR